MHSMSVLSDFFDAWCQWITSNSWQIAFSVSVITIAYAVYKLIAKQVTRMKEQEKLEENHSHNGS